MATVSEDVGTAHNNSWEQELIPMYKTNARIIELAESLGIQFDYLPEDTIIGASFTFDSENARNHYVVTGSEIKLTPGEPIAFELDYILVI